MNKPMSPELQQQYNEMVARGQELARSSVEKAKAVLAAAPPVTMPPLVKKVVVNKPEVRQVEEARRTFQSYRAPVLDPNKPMSDNEPVPDDTLLINGFQEFRNRITPQLQEGRTEIADFTNFVDSIPKACGCVRGNLNQRAEDMYTKLLPVIQVKYPDVFDNFKQTANKAKIIFKEGKTILLEV
jgi:hypothetical protein